ncbi:MAG: putative Methyltransferase [Candidatus Saccharibacteria bacterium]|nr:putative Methyltransferase [Candidatus Saccharibacteria bacterium]
MNVRIIAGRFGGRIIEGSGTTRTHPMSERIRNALFNKIATEIKGAEVLDAFAGSGALGLESLSRGAHHVTFVEKDRIAQKIIDNNIAVLNVSGQSTHIKANVSSWLNKTNEHYDLIFADPPFHDPQLSTVSDLFALLKPNGLMVLSYPGRGEMPTETGVVVVDNRSYGNAALAFYRKEEDA